jgi:hypothetical protein
VACDAYGAQQAHPIAIACSPVPEGHDHGTLRMLAGKAVELGYVAHIDSGPIRNLLTDTPPAEAGRSPSCSPVFDAHRKESPIFSGKRMKRRLYRAADGTPINADVNGAYNIIRKVAPEAFTQGSRGCVVHPMRLAV